MRRSTCECGGGGILSKLFRGKRYVERMRKQKLRGGKQAVAGAQQKQPLSKDWKVDLNAASRALALRWLRAARERLEGVSDDDLKRFNCCTILVVS